MYIIRKQKKSRLLTLSLSLFVLWAVALMMRLIFFFKFSGEDLKNWDHLQEILMGFYLGGKFDFRVIIITLLPVILMTLFVNPKHTKIQNNLRRFFWALQYWILLIFILIFVVDFGHYAYLNFRVNASFLDTLENPIISAQMVWETYPVIPLFMGIFLLAFVMWYLLRKINHRYWLITEFSNASFPFPFERMMGFILLALLFYGKLSYFPLRWSEAFYSTNPFLGNLATNPHLSLFETWRFKSPEYDMKAVKKSYQTAADFFGVRTQDQEPKNLEFMRRYSATAHDKDDYNVVVIQTESLAFNKTSLSGNPLDPTPLLRELGPKSLYYSRCYTPTEATARGVFATLTGIPDVTFEKSSSRNPLLTDQAVLMNQFPQHEKFYFLGGSANWGNIRALFTRNVTGINIFEEGSFQSPRGDVWGISDLDLFKEANLVLSTLNKPFVAYIQTAGFHRPYTIPKDNDEFQIRNDFPQEKVVRFGFDSIDEYNSIRFQDHAIARFIALASKEKYFEKTLFVIFGDHGLPSQHSDHLPQSFISTRLVNHHVPLLFYGPGWLAPKQVDDVLCSQVDIFPTVMGILGRSYETRTFGRNLLDPRLDESSNQAFLFSFHLRPKHISLVDKKYLYVETDSTKELIDIFATGPVKNVATEFPELVETKSKMANHLFDTARYLRYFNKKP
ncbi:MAG: LTA synthase family protein [Bacteriovoracaceae bacterium]|nr:LTA synthase family protein [Bacteriovoracaceae bacterium]